LKAVAVYDFLLMYLRGKMRKKTGREAGNKSRNVKETNQGRNGGRKPTKTGSISREEIKEVRDVGREEGRTPRG
jgi:hypothetical protein